MKSLNDTNCIHDNKINNIAKFNLLHGILNYYKYTKIWIAIIPVFYTDVWVHEGTGKLLSAFEYY